MKKDKKNATKKFQNHDSSTSIVVKCKLAMFVLETLCKICFSFKIISCLFGVFFFSLLCFLRSLKNAKNNL